MAQRPSVQTPLDRYVVLEYLAEGGMGAIYLGKKLGAGGFEKEVVLKQLLPEFTQQPEFIDLFLREARLSATLDHANIVHTIDLVNAGEEFFIVMEYVRGGDLRTLLKRSKRRRRRFPPQAALFVAREILSALSYAHTKVGPDGRPLGLIHRDVSPSNVLISGQGEVKLTDFGIAKASTHRSIFYRVKGKVGYMSPEQARGEPLDPRSDLYSVAVCLYEMLTGERLFVAASLTTSADELYSQPIPAVSKKRQDLPRDLDKVMFKALSMDPKMRYQTAGEFQEALIRVAHRNGLMAGAGEVARMLVETCGGVEEWSSPNVKESAREGTEAYAAQGTDKIALADLEELGEGRGEHTQHTAGIDDEEGSSMEAEDDVSAVSDLDAYLIEEEPSADEWARGQTSGRVHFVKRRPTTNHARLTGLELTSLIRADERTQLGARPLVDLGEPPPPRGDETANLPPRAPSGPAPSVAPARPTAAPRGASVGLPTERVRPLERSRFVYLVLPILVVAGAAVGLVIAMSGPELTPAQPAPRPRVSAPTPDVPAKGVLQMKSDPPGARVLVEKKERCVTPCAVDSLSTVSTNVVRVELDGYLPWSSLVDLQTGAAERVARLRKRPAPGSKWGALLIRANAPADVSIDGKPVGHVTTEGPLELPAGQVELTLVAASGATKQVKATVKANETTPIDVSLR